MGLVQMLLEPLTKDSTLSDIPQPLLHLEVLLKSLLTEALGQSQHSPLQLVAQSNLGWGAPVLLSQGHKCRVLQENRVVLVHPVRKNRVLPNVRRCWLEKHLKQSKKEGTVVSTSWNAWLKFGADLPDSNQQN